MKWGMQRNTNCCSEGEGKEGWEAGLLHSLTLGSQINEGGNRLGVQGRWRGGGRKPGTLTGTDNCVRPLQAPEALRFYDFGARHLLAAFSEALLCGTPRDISRDQTLQQF